MLNIINTEYLTNLYNNYKLKDNIEVSPTIKTVMVVALAVFSALVVIYHIARCCAPSNEGLFEEVLTPEPPKIKPKQGYLPEGIFNHYNPSPPATPIADHAPHKAVSPSDDDFNFIHIEDLEPIDDAKIAQELQDREFEFPHELHTDEEYARKLQKEDEEAASEMLKTQMDDDEEYARKLQEELWDQVEMQEEKVAALFIKKYLNSKDKPVDAPETEGKPTQLVEHPKDKSVTPLFKEIEDICGDIAAKAVNRENFSALKTFEAVDPKVKLQVIALYHEINEEYKKRNFGRDHPTVLGLTKLIEKGPELLDFYRKNNFQKDSEVGNEQNPNFHYFMKYSFYPYSYDPTAIRQACVLAILRLPYMLAEAAYLTKTHKGGVLQAEFYDKLFASGLNLTMCFEGRTEALLKFCVDWRKVLDDNSPQSEAKKKLEAGMFGLSMKTKDANQVIKDALDNQKLMDLLDPTEKYPLSGRDLATWMREEELNIVNFLNEKGLFEQALYQEDEERDYLLLDRKTLKTFLEKKLYPYLEVF